MRREARQSVDWRDVACKSLIPFIGLLLFAPSGCGHKPPPVPAAEARIGRLGLMYGIYAGQHQGRPPTSMKDLRGHAERSTSPEEMAAFEVASVDELFVSPRDGQPYKLITLPRLPPPVAGQPGPVVVYEQDGLGGKRLVSYLGGATEEVDAEKFRQLVPQVK